MSRAMIPTVLACAGLLAAACGGEPTAPKKVPATAAAKQAASTKAAPAPAKKAPTTQAPAPDPRPKCVGEGPDGRALTLKTDDGVDLIADLYLGGPSTAAAAILLHMIPPHHDRSNFTPEFIKALTDRGITVVNVNRRGAKGSGGDAKAAYKGDNGWLDAKAARDFLVNHACPVTPGKIAFVGASNGTTTALDYTVRSMNDTTRERPAALVYLSGGPYTEGQHTLADHKGGLASIPMLFAFPRKEAEWNRGVETLGAGAPWKFVEYDPGAHGTNMFKSNPESVALVASFLGDALGG